MPMTEAAIDRSPLRDLYVSLGDDLGGGSWTVRVHKPLVNWIWIGCVIMALGGRSARSTLAIVATGATRNRIRQRPRWGGMMQRPVCHGCVRRAAIWHRPLLQWQRLIVNSLAIAQSASSGSCRPLHLRRASKPCPQSSLPRLPEPDGRRQ